MTKIDAFCAHNIVSGYAFDYCSLCGKTEVDCVIPPELIEDRTASESSKQPSGGGFIAVDAIVRDLTNRKGLRQVWEAIDRDTQAEIKHVWALEVTQVLDMQVLILKKQFEEK